MRLVLLVTVGLLLAGCAFPGEETSTTSPFKVCPQWMQGPGEFHGVLEHNDTKQAFYTVTPASLTDGRFSLDLIRLHFDVQLDGQLQVRVYRLNGTGGAGEQLNLVDYRAADPKSVPVVTFTQAQKAELDVYLTGVNADAEPRPSGVVVKLDFQGRDVAAAFDTSFHYRICGAQV